MLSKLKSEWETKEILAENPTEKMKCEVEIEKLRAKIKPLKEELTKLI
jgi:hypothetical protein